MVAKKDYAQPKHEAVEVPNLQVIKLMQSLKSRGYVKETFNWQWFYWYLTNEGIEYLRAYLHLPAEIVPATLKKQAARPTRPAAPAAGGFGRGRFDKDKSVGPSGEFQPEFVRFRASGWCGGGMSGLLTLFCDVCACQSQRRGGQDGYRREASN
jgi:small subunit ribosomal protein S10e